MLLPRLVKLQERNRCGGPQPSYLPSYPAAMPNPLTHPLPWCSLVHDNVNWSRCVKMLKSYDFSHLVVKLKLFAIPVGVEEHQALRCTQPGCLRVFVGPHRASALGSHLFRGSGLRRRAHSMVNSCVCPVCGFTSTTIKGARDYFELVCSSVPFVPAPRSQLSKPSSSRKRRKKKK